MITTTWQFPAFDVYPTYETEANAVHIIHWRVKAEDGLGHASEAYGTVECGPIDVNNFVPFEDLTQEIVQGWCDQQLGAEIINQIQVGLVGRINEQVSPTLETLAAPW